MKGDRDLFTAEAMHDICRSEDTMVQPYLPLTTLGNTTTTPVRCRSHSLPWYIMLLTGKDTCYDINEEDMAKVKALLKQCFPLYKSGRLKQEPKATDNDGCYKGDFIHKIFEYLVDSDFIKQTESGPVEVGKLTHTLLIVNSENIQFDEWFITVINGKNLKTGSVEIVGLFKSVGRKLKVFADFISGELWLFGFAASLILFIMFVYLQSIVLVVATLFNIVFSFNMAYFLYHVVCRIDFFPFMNLLSGVVIIAVAADDVFIFYDTWHKQRKDITTQQRGPLTTKQLETLTSGTFRHATAAIFVTSFTTAAAFFANCVSNITAVKCFGIFSGFVILTNFLLMITWTPSVVILAEKMPKKCSLTKTKWFSSILGFFHRLEVKVFRILIPNFVARAWVVIVLVFTVLAASGLVAVFYYPKLHLPETTYIRLFTRGTPMLMENYETHLSRQFPFTASTDLTRLITQSMKIQFIWGLQPIDNGRTFDADPTKSATLVPSASFNMTSIPAQRWLLETCRNIMNQTFFKPSTCMFDYYTNMLQSKCTNPLYRLGLRTCCDIKSFPARPDLLELCLPKLDALAFYILATNAKQNHGDLYEMSGRPVFDRKTNQPVAFFMNVYTHLTMTTAYSENTKAYDTINDYALKVLQTAPPGLEGGWWSSFPALLLYDLQKALKNGVFYSITFSLAVTLAMMLFTSLNFIVTFLAGTTIILVIASTLGSLVMSGWELNILESITLSLAVGLSIDFTIHYGIAFKLSEKSSSVEKMKDSVSKVGSAVAMAALTTFAAGAAMMPTRIMAYYELGTFLMVVMSFSWSFSTFFFQAVCSVIGPLSTKCQIDCHFSKCLQKLWGSTRRVLGFHSGAADAEVRTAAHHDDELIDISTNNNETYADDVPILR